MAEWKIVYQDTPFSTTRPSSLVIKASSVEQALATAYDHLTRAGHVVCKIVPDNKSLDNPYCHQVPDHVNLEKLQEFLGVGVDLDYLVGSTHIRGCQLHLTTGLGTVL